MSRKKVNAAVCDVCGSMEIIGPGEPPLGITIARASYDNETGGGPVPKDLFVCSECVHGNREHGPVELCILIALANGPLDLDDLAVYYGPVEEL